MGSEPNAPFTAYEDFDPYFEWDRQDAMDTVTIHLPGFKKEHLKVQLGIDGNLRTSGHRPLDSNRWSRFLKDFNVPKNCSIMDIRAKFENEKLLVLFPKSVDAEPPEEPVPAPAPAPPAAPPAAPAPPPKEPVPAPAPAPPAAPAPRPAAPAAPPAAPAPRPAAPAAPPAAPAPPPAAPAPPPEEPVPAPAPAAPARPPAAPASAPTVNLEPKTDGKPSDETKIARTLKPDEAITGIAMEQTPARKGLLLNVAVATLVLLGLVLYLKHKLTKAETK